MNQFDILDDYPCTRRTTRVIPLMCLTHVMRVMVDAFIAFYKNIKLDKTKDFRAISLITNIHKIISKKHKAKMQKELPKTISPSNRLLLASRPFLDVIANNALEA